MADSQLVRVDGRRLRVSGLEKLMYPETGTTKGEVIDYFLRIAAVMLPHLTGRPITRKRWVEGVGTQAHPQPSFFAKELEAGAPDWIPRARIEHSGGARAYPLAEEPATLVYLAQLASLELHVPQWRFAPDAHAQRPDRLVLDLDPGPGTGLSECAQVAGWARAILEDMGLKPMPVTSGSKGIHLYASLPGEQTSDQVSAMARELAQALAADHGELVVASMAKSLRPGKVFVDWSQNNGTKTTIAPYSLRGTSRPFVAAPRTWDELRAADLQQLLLDDVLGRMETLGDPLAVLIEDRPDSVPGPLGRYIAKRHAGRTPEPVPSSHGASVGQAGAPSFVIQEHHATRLHWDLRLERGGVLVSWAVPRGIPPTSRANHLAIQTEDHPLAYGHFEGIIPKGEYGGGTVSIWDAGTYDLEKWRDDEIIFTLHGRRQSVRLALIRTHGEGEKSTWLLRRTTTDAQGAPQPDAGDEARPDVPARRTAEEAQPPRGGPTPPHHTPMLARPGTLGQAHELARRSGRAPWVELKFDGVRAFAIWRAGVLRLQARSGTDITARYPELTAPEAVVFAADSAVLDGEIVALDAQGRPSFSLLQGRMQLSDPDEIRRAVSLTHLRMFLFDAIEADGQLLTSLPLIERRAALARIADDPGPRVQVPPVFDDIDATLDAAREHHLEGIVVKDPRAPYREGLRSEAWLKVKLTRTQDVVIGGMRQGQGHRAATFGSLLLGVAGQHGLSYVGRVGTGFDERSLQRIAETLAPLRTEENPFVDVPPSDARDAQWVRPELVGEVEFSEWTAGGALRQARWRGLRTDKRADEVVRE